ncbi:MAG: TetR/AcrR family transcriptional regulator [Nitrospirae bacterium]|nr:MAG: TetR/AcrR family transcriptional regulator [Nitrospirota bacterium]
MFSSNSIAAVTTIKPLSRSARVSASQRKASIIAAATRLFASKGFYGTKTREIAECAGVSEALIFKHFPTKRDLYKAILAAQSPVPGLLAEVRALADRRDDVAVLTHIAQTIVTKAPDLAFMRLMLFSALEEPELSTMFFRQHVRLFYDFLSSYIHQRIREKAFVRVDPLLAARAFMGMLIYHRMLSHLFQMPVARTPRSIVRTLVRIFVEGLRPPRRRSTVRSRRAQRTRRDPVRSVTSTGHSSRR